MIGSLLPNLVSAYVPSLGAYGYTVPDRSRRANNGTLSSTSSAAFGAFGNGDVINFTNARGDKLSTGRNPHGAGNITSLSVTCWARFRAFTNAYNTIFETDDQQAGFSNFQFAGLVKSNGKLALYALQTIATNSSYDGTGNFTLALNTWYFIAFVFRAAVRQEAYVNGRIDGSVASPVSFILGLEKPVIWGGSTQYASSGGGTRLIDADMDEMCRWNRDLSAVEIQWLYSQGRGNLFRRRPTTPYGLFAGGGGGGVAKPVLFHSHYMSQGMRP